MERRRNKRRLLYKTGDVAVDMTATTDVDVNNLFIAIRTAATNKLGGLVLKTYDSDIFNNWVKTDWIDGENGISKVTDGKLSMDALNLAQKVYNMLNRIAISGGTYRDWLETVYASGQYLERCETPTFEGGTSQEVVFQEVVSNSATENEPLGTLAGRGINAGKQKGESQKNSHITNRYIHFHHTPTQIS